MESKKHCNNCAFKPSLFGSLKEDELSLIVNHKETISYSKGEVIYRAGQPVHEYFYIAEGLVKLHLKGASGKEQIIILAKPEDFIGLISIFNKTHYEYSVTAITDCVVCKIDINTMLHLIKTNNLFAIDVLKNESNIYAKILTRTLALHNKNLRGRIAYLLIEFAEIYFNSKTFDLPISRKELSDMIDMTPENVIRILSEFRNDGIIASRAKHIEILDMDILVKFRDMA